jgi:hypothetical protein
MKLAVALLLLTGALAAAGCRMYLWAGSHELTFPPVASDSAEPTPTP